MLLEHPDIKRLSTFLEHELCARDEADLSKHLEACDACRRELEALERVVSGIRSLPKLEPPPGFSAKVMSRLEAQEREGVWAFLLRWRLMPMLAPIAAVSLVVVMARRPEFYDVPMPALERIEKKRPPLPENKRNVAPLPYSDSGAGRELASKESLPKVPEAVLKAHSEGGATGASRREAAPEQGRDEETTSGESARSGVRARMKASSAASVEGRAPQKAKREALTGGEERDVTSSGKVSAVFEEKSGERSMGPSAAAPPADLRDELNPATVAHSRRPAPQEDKPTDESAGLFAPAPPLDPDSVATRSSSRGDELEQARVAEEEPRSDGAGLSRESDVLGGAESQGGAKSAGKPTGEAPRWSRWGARKTSAPPEPTTEVSGLDGVTEPGRDAFTLEELLQPIGAESTEAASSEDAAVRAGAEQSANVTPPPPDAVIALEYRPDLMVRLQRILTELEATTKPQRRLRDGVVRVEIVIPRGTYDKLIKKLGIVTEFGATPAPDPNKTFQRIHLDIYDHP